MMPVDHIFERGQRPDPVVFGFMRVNGAGIQQLAGRPHHGQLGAGAEARIEAEHGLASQWRLGEQGTQVGGKNINGVTIRLFAQFPAHIPFDGRKQQAGG